MLKNYLLMQEMPARSLNQEDSPGGGHGNPLQYSCLENPMDIEAWWAKGHRVAQKRTQLKRLSTHSMHQNCCLNIPTGLLFQQLLLLVLNVCESRMKRPKELESEFIADDIHGISISIACCC